MIHRMILIACFLCSYSCNTVTGTAEGLSRGLINDAKTIHHYSTCMFTKKQCGDLDLD